MVTFDSEILTWYQYNIVSYSNDFYNRHAINDIPMTVFHLIGEDFIYHLGHKYELVEEYKDTYTFIENHTERLLYNKNYYSKTVDFLGNDNLIETYFIKRGKIDCLTFEVIDDKKVNVKF